MYTEYIFRLLWREREREREGERERERERERILLGENRGFKTKLKVHFVPFVLPLWG